MLQRHDKKLKNPHRSPSETGMLIFHVQETATFSRYFYFAKHLLLTVVQNIPKTC